MFKDWNVIVEKCLVGDKGNEVATLSCIPAIFSNVLTAFLMFVGTFALFLFIFAGFKYMNSAGDPKKLEGARNTLIYAIVGLLVVLFSFLIINVISIVTNVECIKSFGFGCGEQAPVNTPIIIPTRPTIQPTETPSPIPRSIWTDQWDPNVTVPAQKWWDDMVAKGHIRIDAVAQQSAGQEISNFLRGANLVPNPVEYYREGYGFINDCNLVLGELVKQGQGHIRITSGVYAQIPGDIKCQVFTNTK